MGKRMIEDTKLIEWLVGLLCVGYGGTLYWIRGKLDDQKERMDKFETAVTDAGSDRSEILLSLREATTELKYMRRDHGEMKEDHKRLAEQLAAHMHSEEQAYARMQSDISILKAGVQALEKRQSVTLNQLEEMR